MWESHLDTPPCLCPANSIQPHPSLQSQHVPFRCLLTLKHISWLQRTQQQGVPMPASKVAAHRSQEIPTLVSKRWPDLHDMLPTKNPQLPRGFQTPFICCHPIFSAHLQQQEAGGNVMSQPGLALQAPLPALSRWGDPRGTQCLPLARSSSRKCFMLLQNAETLTQGSSASSSHLTLLSAPSWWLQGAAFPPPSTWAQSQKYTQHSALQCACAPSHPNSSSTLGQILR